VPPPDDPKSPSTLKVLLIIAACIVGIGVALYLAAWLFG
jgi:hypothetical protein